MAPRPSPLAANPAVTRPLIGPRKKIDRSLKHPRPERRIVGSGTRGPLNQGDAFKIKGDPTMFRQFFAVREAASPARSPRCRLPDARAEADRASRILRAGN